MDRKVIIIGANGHGKVIADIVRSNGDIVVGFLDDDIEKKTLGKIDDWVNFNENEFVVGIGNTEIRRHIAKLNCKWYTAIHSSAVISPDAIIGEGTVVMPNAVVNSGAVIGKHCIINSGAIVEHDNIISDFAHISVGVKLGGTVCVGDSTWVGIGASVCNNINICENCIIGAGAVVVKDINESGIYKGVPARKE